ncbi:MAG: energy-coupling factor transporter transmembrane protein EcfT [Firmicutes bacterium]|nr:energy-coupling factor transporter transmembrane protein EcfT [Bacillota bacterium]
MFYFVAVLIFTLLCMHPAFSALSLAGALSFAWRLKGGASIKKTLYFVGPMFLLIALANPLFNHRGVTMLFMAFDQWITLEATLYGLVSASQLAAVILWFVCYQEVMTSDKFLYLFGQVAPGSSLLITMTLRLIPAMQATSRSIRETHALMAEGEQRLFQKLGTALRNLSTLLTWSMENAVETADSMRARGYGLRRRSTFHLFHFDSRDARTLGLMAALTVVTLLGRCFGHGYMEFYPRLVGLTTGAPGFIMAGAFALLVFLPTILEAKEAVRWRCYGFAN